MAKSIVNVFGSYRQQFTTGNVTTIAAGTGTAGHLLALRWAPASTARHCRIRALEVEFLLTTAFGAAQEVAFDAVVARAYTAAHTAATGTALTLATNDGKARTSFDTTQLTGRIASAAALTAAGSPPTLDANPVAKGSVWCAAVGATMDRWYDFSQLEPGGIILANEEGLIVRNTILMGAAGVGKWQFTVDYDECVVS